MHRTSSDDPQPSPWLIVTGIVAALALVFLLGVGAGREWGAEQWGPVAAWLSGAVTLAAVVVALRQAALARQESMHLEIARLVDHEAGRRRECIKALGDLWAALSKVSFEFSVFEHNIYNMPENFDPKRIRLPEDVPPGGHVGELYSDEFIRETGKFYARWVGIIQPPLFSALAILHGTELFEEINEISDMLVKLATEDSEGTFIDMGNKIKSGKRPDVRTFSNRFGAVYARSEKHLRLVREHFSLKREDIERTVREDFRRPGPTRSGWPPPHTQRC